MTSIPPTCLRVPFAITYASRTELLDEAEMRVNFGVSLDMDQFYALARAAAGSPN